MRRGKQIGQGEQRGKVSKVVRQARGEASKGAKQGGKSFSKLLSRADLLTEYKWFWLCLLLIPFQRPTMQVDCFVEELTNCETVAEMWNKSPILPIRLEVPKTTKKMPKLYEYRSNVTGWLINKFCMQSIPWCKFNFPPTPLK